MTVLHFVAMYILMYAMVNALENVFNSWNQVYMAGLMTASMVLIELPLMSAMYESKRLNAVIMAVGAAALIGFFVLIRQQTAIADGQFLRSMIPHHAGAILMCEQAPNRRPRDQGAVYDHHLEPAIGNRSDENDTRSTGQVTAGDYHPRMPFLEVTAGQAPGKSDICHFPLTGSGMERAASTHEQMRQHPAYYGANALCCCREPCRFGR
jgi:hypothetical protein